MVSAKNMRFSPSENGKMRKGKFEKGTEAPDKTAGKKGEEGEGVRKGGGGGWKRRGGEWNVCGGVGG